MILPLTQEERLCNVEARINELTAALEDIQTTQDKILENDQRLFEIHTHNDEYLKEVMEVQAKNEQTTKEIVDVYNELMEECPLCNAEQCEQEKS